jgi:hypothetical protein
VGTCKRGKEIQRVSIGQLEPAEAQPVVDQHHRSQPLLSQGRSRMDGNGRLQGGQPPRGLNLATGEEVPRGPSLRARMLIVEVGQGEVKRSVERKPEGRAPGRFVTSHGGLAPVVGEPHNQELSVTTRRDRPAHPALRPEPSGLFPPHSSETMRPGHSSAPRSRAVARHG